MKLYQTLMIDGEANSGGRPGACTTARVCSYTDFMKMPTLNLNGNDGVVGLFDGLDEDWNRIPHQAVVLLTTQEKFATCTLLGVALNLWIGEIKKLKIELWNLKVKKKPIGRRFTHAVSKELPFDMHCKSLSDQRHGRRNHSLTNNQDHQQLLPEQICGSALCCTTGGDCPVLKNQAYESTEEWGILSASDSLMCIGVLNKQDYLQTTLRVVSLMTCAMGTEGAVGLVLMVREDGISIPHQRCTIDNQVKFATCTLLVLQTNLGWTSHVRTLGNVMSARPKTLDDDIRIGQHLMDQKLRTLRSGEKKPERRILNPLCPKIATITMMESTHRSDCPVLKNKVDLYVTLLEEVNIILQVLAKVGAIAYKLELPQELSRVHSTFHVSNLKKCYSDEPLAIPLDGKRVDDKLHFVEEPVEVIDQPKFLIKMFPRRSEGEELEYPFFEGDDSSSDEWKDYGMAGDDYEGPPIFDDDQYEEESMPVYDTDIEDVIEEEEVFIEKGRFGGKEDNIEDVVVMANDLYSSMIQTTCVNFSKIINSNPHELIWFQKVNLVEVSILIGKKYHEGYLKDAPMDDKLGFKTIKVADIVALFSRASFTLLASYSLLPHYLIKGNLAICPI
ncbi:hypothetical protein Tco_0510755 [Tanacetum coccineum]